MTGDKENTTPPPPPPPPQEDDPGVILKEGDKGIVEK